MKVVIINRSDSIGGAAIASHRLLHALIDEGVEAHMLVIDKQLTDDPTVVTVGNCLNNKWNFLTERISIALRTGLNRDTLFKIDPATHGLNLSRHPLVKDADVIVMVSGISSNWDGSTRGCSRSREWNSWRLWANRSFG